MQPAAAARRGRHGRKVTEPAIEPHLSLGGTSSFALLHRTLSRTPVPVALLRLVDMRVSPPPCSCRTMASLLGTTSSARSKSRSSRPRPRPRPRPRRPRPSRRTRPRPRRPRPWRHRRRGNALSASAPSPSSASPLRADSRRLRCSSTRTLCTLRQSSALVSAPCRASYLHTAFHPALLTTPLPLAGPHACHQHGHQHHQPDLVQPKLALLDCGPSSLV